MARSKWDPKEWERKLMRMITAQEAGVEQIFSEFINASSPALTRYSHTKSVAIWHRNKAVEAQLNRQLITLHQQLTTYLKSQSTAAWDLASMKTDLLVADYIHGMSISKIAREGFFDRNLAALEAFQKRAIGGMDLSARVWDVCEQAKQNVGLYLQSGVGTGRSASQLSRDVRAMMNNPDKRFRRIRDPETGKLRPSRPMANYHPGQGVYRSSYQNALRMTRTETNMAYYLSDHERWKKLDFVVGKEVQRSAGGVPCGLCDGMVGKYPKSFVFATWHPNCWCRCVPVLASQDVFVENLLNDTPPTGHIKAIPLRAQTYVAKHTKQFNNWKNSPYWLRDNFTLQGGKYVPKDALKVVPKGVIATAK